MSFRCLLSLLWLEKNLGFQTTYFLKLWVSIIIIVRADFSFNYLLCMIWILVKLEIQFTWLFYDCVTWCVKTGFHHWRAFFLFQTECILTHVAGVFVPFFPPWSDNLNFLGVLFSSKIILPVDVLAQSGTSLMLIFNTCLAWTKKISSLLL